MNQPRLDVYSQEYKELLAKDNEAHRIRTNENVENGVSWVYDPVECNSSHAWLYEAILGAEFECWNRIMRDRFPDRARIIDLGCGPGGSSLWFAVRGHDVVGIDACQDRIEVARRLADHHKERIERAGGRLRFVACDFFEYEPEQHEAVVTVKTLHHIPDIEATVRRFARNLTPNGTFFVLDQMGESGFSNCAFRIGRALYPPGFCKSSWYSRQRAAAGAVLRLLRLMKPETPLHETIDDPLEGIGQTLTLPTFRRLFKKIEVHEVDPLRVLFVGIDLKEAFCKRWILSPLLALNALLRLTGPSFERGIVAHLEDMVS
jgi:2-polyprenyl-3-methyl-5-hydroxy-6-metoxy-1,4-benzoquinol methylase